MDVKGANVVNSLIEGARSAIAEVGWAGLHALGPENFEYYMCSLELFDSQGNTEAYMIFPVMPNNMMESKTQIATVSKTATGVVTLFNSTFNPVDISIQGTFGRKIRLLLGQKEYQPTSSKWKMAQKFFNGNPFINVGIKGKNMDSDIMLIKSGYGLTQMMRHILDAVYELDENGAPRMLVFTNYSMNTSYVVEPLQKFFNQSTENSTLWYYNVEMKATADATKVLSSNPLSAGKFLGKVAVGQISKFIGNLVNDCMQMIAL